VCATARIPSSKMAQSPANSPRLPSPPPMAEDQLGPASPSANPSEKFSKLSASATNDQAAQRRILPGTKSEDMHEGPPLVDLQEVCACFSLQVGVAGLKMLPDRLCFPAHRTSQSPARLPYTPYLRSHDFHTGRQKHGAFPRTASARRRSRHLALRALPLPHAKS